MPVELIPIAWKIVNADSIGHTSTHIRDLTLDLVEQADGSFLYAIRQGSRTCLNRKGEWEFEPMNTGKDKRFLKRCRFATIEEATEHIQKFVNKHDAITKALGGTDEQTAQNHPTADQ